MKKIIVNTKIITTSLFLKNLVEKNNKGKYKFIDKNYYVAIGVEDTFNFKRCHDFFLESICLFFGDKYEKPELPAIKKKAYVRPRRPSA